MGQPGAPDRGPKEGPKRATFRAPGHFGAGLGASPGPREPPPGTPRPLRAHPPTAQKFLFLSNPAIDTNENIWGVLYDDGDEADYNAVQMKRILCVT